MGRVLLDQPAIQYIQGSVRLDGRLGTDDAGTSQQPVDVDVSSLSSYVAS